MNPNHPTEIPFTQYLRPDGQSRDVFFDASPETHFLAKGLMDRGLRFEAEVLTTGEVSLTVYDPKLEEDIAIQICPNGPGIENHVDMLVKEAYELTYGGQDAKT